MAHSYIFGSDPPGDSIFFISDVHMGSDDREEEDRKKENLFSFFEMVYEQGRELYILGDLFEFWFEYGPAVPGIHAGLLAWMWRLRRRGIRINYIVGNHDYWAGRFFEEEMGMNVYKNPITRKFGDRRIFLTHGDGHGRGDVGYKILKRVLRNRFTIFLFGLLHPRIGFQLARITSNASKADYERKSELASRILRTHALERLKADDTDVFMTGHTHRPELINDASGCFINLGDWIRHFTYAEMKNGSITLKKWGPVVEEIGVMDGKAGSRGTGERAGPGGSADSDEGTGTSGSVGP